ncbi:MAG: TetR family transcriptional regulator C-terminal domain-containing protein [Deltaproteobacteria bacterium]|nr:TetR family transcriptional regulator C-terminal domain-containing protein [Deltaproteobacteria bacterium]
MARKSKAGVRKREILEHFYQVLAKEGLEGASIGKIAKHMGMHPSLVIHYFKTKEAMTVELVDVILERYEKTYLPKLDEIKDPEQRLDTFLNAIFGLGWVKLIDVNVFFACYYLSFRNDRVKERFKKMYARFKEVLINEIKICIDKGIIKKTDPEKTAESIIVLAEGLDFYENVCGDDRQFEELGHYLKGIALRLLKGNEDQD